LISRKMTRNILCQSIFQLALLAALLLHGASIFSVAPESREHLTVVFNTFVFCQVFNELNARSIGDQLNVFLDLHRNILFLSIIIFTAVAQVFIVQFGGEFVRTAPLSGDQWMKCICLGALSLPLGGLMRLIPVSESIEDFAELSPLMRESYEKEKKLSDQRHKQSASRLSLSSLVWLATVGAIPVIAYQQFQGPVAAILDQPR
jgi:magnesium-transporting ATPase (P-type)